MCENILWTFSGVLGTSTWDDQLTALGAGGVFVILVLKEIFAFLKNFLEKRKNDDAAPPSQSQIVELPNAETLRRLAKLEADNKEFSKILEAIHGKLSELHQWHDVNEPNLPGVKTWWGSQINHNLEFLKQSSKEIHIKLEEMEKRLPRRGS